MLDNLKIFDSNVMIGRYTVFNENSFYKISDLIKYMNYYGIHKVLLYHSLSKEYNPEYGNNSLSDVVSRLEDNIKSRLVKCYSIFPRFSKTLPSPENVIRKIKKQDFKVIRIFPKTHSYSLKKRNFSDYFLEFEKIRMPILVDYGNFLSFKANINNIDWEDVYNICNNYPKIPFILIRPDFVSSIEIYLLLKNTKNLYIEFSAYWSYRAIESICEEFGAERLIFGSNMPHSNPGCALGLLKFANINIVDMKKIAFENLDTLLKW